MDCMVKITRGPCLGVEGDNEEAGRHAHREDARREGERAHDRVSAQRIDLHQARRPGALKPINAHTPLLNYIRSLSKASCTLVSNRRAKKPTQDGSLAWCRARASEVTVGHSRGGNGGPRASPVWQKVKPVSRSPQAQWRGRAACRAGASLPCPPSVAAAAPRGTCAMHLARALCGH